MQTATPMDPILLAEDDPVSAAFLAEGLSAFARVERSEDGRTALACARRVRFALLVLDARLPGLDGAEVLSALRADPDAASRTSPALAITAQLDEAAIRRLTAAGFDEALAKPLRLATLQAAAGRWLRSDTLPRLADDAALAALGGRSDLLERMRKLFAEELPGMRQAIARAVAAERSEEVRALLHRLRSGCGFCGTPALAAAAARLEHALAQRLGVERALVLLLAECEACESALRVAPGHGSPR